MLTKWKPRRRKKQKGLLYLSALPLTLKNLDQHTRLVVGERGENLGLLGWDGGVSGDELGHLPTGGLDTQGQWRNIEEKDLGGRLGRSVTGENGSLDGSTVGNSLIRVDGLVGLLAIEVVGDEFLDSGDTGGTSDEDDLVDLGLVDLRISKDSIDWGGSGSEKVLAKLLETSAGDGGVEIDTLE